jgi:hypothetical protein
LILEYIPHNEKSEVFDTYERFINFINFNEKDIIGKDIFNKLISRLESYKIPLLDCR